MPIEIPNSESSESDSWPRISRSISLARIVLDNPHGLLAPGMFAQVSLKPGNDVEHPLVPTDALIGSGAQTRVIVLGDDDTFHPMAVQPGRSIH